MYEQEYRNIFTGHVLSEKCRKMSLGEKKRKGNIPFN